METNKFKRAWIWLWYNNITRFLTILGLPMLIVLLVTALIFGPGVYLRTVAIGTYSLFLLWMVVDNDYSNLRRIGMDEYRKKLPPNSQ